jgi:HSP20 family protein
MNTVTKTNNGWRARNLFPGTLIPNDFFTMNWPGLDLFNGNEYAWLPAANLIENEKSFSVELSVPGYLKKDITVKVENNLLNISGSHKTEKSKEKKNYSRQEFSCDSFSRSFELPENVNEESITAKYTEGVLVVELPKSTVIPPKKKIKEITVD